MAARRKGTKIQVERPGVLLERYLARSRARFPKRQDFAEAVAISPGRLSQLIAGVGGPPSPKLARRIEAACRNSIPFAAWFETPAGPQ